VEGNASGSIWTLNVYWFFNRQLAANPDVHQSATFLKNELTEVSTKFS
jgi:hypothetical protein